MTTVIKTKLPYTSNWIIMLVWETTYCNFVVSWPLPAPRVDTILVFRGAPCIGRIFGNPIRPLSRSWITALPPGPNILTFVVLFTNCRIRGRNVMQSFGTCQTQCQSQPSCPSPRGVAITGRPRALSSRMPHSMPRGMPMVSPHHIYYWEIKNSHSRMIWTTQRCYQRRPFLIH